MMPDDQRDTDALSSDRQQPIPADSTSAHLHINTSAHSGRIFLLGIMGTGKTYWAQRIAKLLNVDWIDLDQQIEKATSMTIKEIFAAEGEEYFRLKERDTLRQFAAIDNLVVAVGGGTPCFYDNMDWMNENGTTIWLDAHMDLLIERLIRGKHKRPLLAHLSDDELRDYIINKKQERHEFYSRAHYHLHADEIGIDNFKRILHYAE